MSVTFTIRNNVPYSNEKDLVVNNVDECCTDKRCPYCEGTNRFEFPTYPFELNMANGNFATFTAALGGFDSDDYMGSMDGRTLSNLLKSFDMPLAVRGATETHEPGKAHVYECGLSREQLGRYVTEMTKIAHEAERREEDIVWA